MHQRSGYWPSNFPTSHQIICVEDEPKKLRVPIEKTRQIAHCSMLTMLLVKKFSHLFFPQLSTVDAPIVLDNFPTKNSISSHFQAP